MNENLTAIKAAIAAFFTAASTFLGWQGVMVEVVVAEIQFQHGPRNEEGSTMGVLDCDLLEIVRDRLQHFQQGEFATRENAHALAHIEEALMWMNKRVEDRAERSVLGTYNK